MDDVVIGGVNITRELIDEFKTGWQLEAVRARARQLEAAKQRRYFGPARDTEEARLRVQVDPFWYHYWGRREGYGIWRDRGEVDRFVRDNPELRVEKEKKPVIHGHRFASTSQDPRGGPRSSDSALLDTSGEVSGAVAILNGRGEVA